MVKLSIAYFFPVIDIWVLVLEPITRAKTSKSKACIILLPHQTQYNRQFSWAVEYVSSPIWPVEFSN